MQNQLGMVKRCEPHLCPHCVRPGQFHDLSEPVSSATNTHEHLFCTMSGVRLVKFQLDPFRALRPWLHNLSELSAPPALDLDERSSFVGSWTQGSFPQLCAPHIRVA